MGKFDEKGGDLSDFEHYRNLKTIQFGGSLAPHDVLAGEILEKWGVVTGCYGEDSYCRDGKNYGRGKFGGSFGAVDFDLVPSEGSCGGYGVGSVGGVDS
jgi:hypothetical protein